MQRALLKGPGWVSLILCCDRLPGVDSAGVRQAAGRLIAAASARSLFPNLSILVGLGWPALADFEPFTKLAGGVDRALLQAWGAPETEHDIFVQVAVQTGVDLEIARRVVDWCLKDAVSTAPAAVTLTGNRMLNGQEQFGFPDGIAPEWDSIATAMNAGAVNDVKEAMSKKAGDDKIEQTFFSAEAPGSWLLFLPLRQNIESFYGRSDMERAAVLGRAPATLVDPADRTRAAAVGAQGGPQNSHYQTMTRTPLAMLRRGFPCRLPDGPGLAFVGAAEHPAVLAEALGRFFGTASAPKDALAAFVDPRPGALFYCPPGPHWLGADAEVAPWPPQIAAFLNRKAPMTIYEVAESFATYLMTLKGDGVFVGEPGKMTFAPQVQTALDAFHAVVAAGTPDKGAKALLDRLAKQSEKDANDINASAGDYVTFN